MPKLIIDNREVEVPAGTSVLEAARRLGIVIPHFCYHPALGSVGACRLCAMKFLDGPVKGVQMSCMVPAQDGMVVSTGDAEALRMRQLVIEWLMINHPHDCPVCDEGGECLLQDYTIAGGHGIRRYQGKKRTFLNQDLGPHVEHEMNRCIECYRCVRFYQEFAGGTDLGVMGSAARVYFGRFRDGALESPFAGNLVDICPTGVYTDKTARFRARYWDYEMAPSVCPHCSLGCNTTPAARYRELLKTIARVNPAVNGWFICDRGRFSNAVVNEATRPRTPRVDGREATWDDALDALATGLKETTDEHGPGAVAVVGSPRLAQEGNVLLARLAQHLGAGFLCYATGDEAEREAAALAALDGARAASIADVRSADCIAILDTDLTDEGPMMLLAVREAWRKGAPVFLVGKHSPLAQAATVSIEAVELSILEEVPLAIFEHPVVICGTKHNSPDAIRMLSHAGEAGARLACLVSGPNAMGSALLAREHGAASFTAAVASGRVKGVIAVEADIPAELLAGVAVLAALDWRATAAVEQARVFLPATAWVEMDGTFVNYEGRAQRFARVMEPGLPLKGLDPALHPPREHRRVAPGGDLRPAWRAIADIIERLGGERIAEPYDGQWEILRTVDPQGEGFLLLQER